MLRNISFVISCKSIQINVNIQPTLSKGKRQLKYVFSQVTRLRWRKTSDRFIAVFIQNHRL